MTDEELIAAARAAALRGLRPLLPLLRRLRDRERRRRVVTGANMENACYRLGVCAEQSALTAAQLAFGLDKVARIAVAGGDGSGRRPGGRRHRHPLRRLPPGDPRSGTIERPRRRNHLLLR